MGLSGLQPNDELWLLHGAKVPFILRPANNGCHRVISECFVLDIMCGEAWPEDESKLTTVTLV